MTFALGFALGFVAGVFVASVAYVVRQVWAYVRDGGTG